MVSIGVGGGWCRGHVISSLGDLVSGLSIGRRSLGHGSMGRWVGVSIGRRVGGSICCCVGGSIGCRSSGCGSLVWWVVGE